MLKPYKTEFQGKPISLECTHKSSFPPPQMYGHTGEDIDKMWKQGAIDQNLHQSLKIWRDNCGLFVMGDKCMSCPLALLQKPRPGRPHVIETENWMIAQRRLILEEQRTSRQVQQSVDSVPLSMEEPELEDGTQNEDLPE
jgi:hypothetical protein